MKKIMSIFTLFLLSALAVPAWAAPENFQELVNTIIYGVMRPVVPLLIGAGVVIFIYGVLLTMLSKGGEKKEEGKQFMFWGIVGIFVMVSVWGLVAILTSTFGLDNDPPRINIDLPIVKHMTLQKLT